MKVLIGVGSFILLIAMVVGGSYITAFNGGNRMENNIVAQYDDMQNILGQYSLKVGEAVQVTNMYKDDLKDVVIGQMSGRYGSDGSKATFQWLKEHNITLEPEMYANVQKIIEAGRNKYENTQTKFIDVKRVYNTQLGSFWGGTWLRIAGYPIIDLEKYQIIKSQHGIETFETGVDNGLTLR